MLEASGRRAVAAGNIGLPLLDAVGGDAEVVVAEVSSFQLALTTSLPPRRGRVAELLGRPPGLARHRRRLPRRQGQAVGQQRARATSPSPTPRTRSCSPPSQVPRARGADRAHASGSRPGGRHPAPDGALVGPDGAAVARGRRARPDACRTTWSTPCAPWRTASAAGASPEGCRPGLLGVRVGSPTGSSWSARLTGCGSTTTPRRPRPAPCWPRSRGVPRPC